MADVYENASITIAATCSSDSDQGCFSRTQDSMKARPLLDTGLFVRVVKPRFPLTQYDTFNGPWPLLERAWVYQERKLSPRVAHLAKEQLYWECNTVFLSEDGDEDRQDLGTKDFKHQLSDPENDWTSTLEHYSRLSLTFDTDRLPAISAVVKRMQPLREDDTYIVGMWLSSLLRDLVWHVVTAPTRPRPEDSYPTWSWVSVNNGICWNRKRGLLPPAQLISTDYDITGPAHIGRTTKASITISGPAVTVEYTGRREPSNLSFMLRGAVGSVQDILCVLSDSKDFDYSTAKPPILPGEELTLLLLCYCSTFLFEFCEGIVLRLKERNVYERVGWIELQTNIEPPEERQRSLNDFCSLPTKQFTIV